jgi:hypothetical protein
MGRSLAIAYALALAAPGILLPAAAGASDRALPMHFELRLQGPPAACAGQCRLMIAASGAITAETPQDFETFAHDRNLSGAMMVLDSDGGSVHGAIKLGRAIRRLNLDTTVGRLIDLDSARQATPRASLSPHADCESMCAFVLLGGVHRVVPSQARVMVHQIWLGDRRNDPTAANYSAEDLVLVQRDIGRLAQYTVDMGGSIELLDLSLRIPPWEPMHTLTADETRRMHVATLEQPAPQAGATVASSAAATPVARLNGGATATEISERRWGVIDRAGSAVLARRHPLTVEGDEIGSFDLIVACGARAGNYHVSYIERRHDGDQSVIPARLASVDVTVGNLSTPLKVVSSERRSQPDELVTYAAGDAAASSIEAFAAAGSHSMVIGTRSFERKGALTKNGYFTTDIRLGNTGAQASLAQLTAACSGKALGDRAALPVPRTGSIASVK